MPLFDFLCLGSVRHGLQSQINLLQGGGGRAPAQFPAVDRRLIRSGPRRRVDLHPGVQGEPPVEDRLETKKVNFPGHPRMGGQEQIIDVPFGFGLSSGGC